MMRAFLAAVLSVIAVGVLLIAYGLLNPRVMTADPYSLARPMLANERVGLNDGAYPSYNYPNYPSNGIMQPGYGYPVNQVRAVPAYQTYEAPARRRAVRTEQVRVVERSRGRDWKRTALVIGGTTATGAGLGAIFGGKKGALIGAALGGGAGTLYEVKKQ